MRLFEKVHILHNADDGGGLWTPIFGSTQSTVRKTMFSVIKNRQSRTVIAAGASVTGKVAFAKRRGSLSGEANLQLTQTSIDVDNANLPVVTFAPEFRFQDQRQKQDRQIHEGLGETRRRQG
jgi:hypothetical protein